MTARDVVAVDVSYAVRVVVLGEGKKMKTGSRLGSYASGGAFGFFTVSVLLLYLPPTSLHWHWDTSIYGPNSWSDLGTSTSGLFVFSDGVVLSAIGGFGFVDILLEHADHIGHRQSKLSEALHIQLSSNVP